MKINTIHQLKNKLDKSHRICIIGHKNPDGDALGSALGLHHFLKLMQIESKVIMPNNFPDFLKWMPGSDSVLIFDKEEEKCSTTLSKADLVFTLDFNHLSRTGQMEALLKGLNTPFVMIDHHQEPGDYAEYSLVNTTIASTCELVYQYITESYPHIELSANVARCLYTGIMTDTGSFRFPSTTSKTHRIVAELIDAGAENATIHQQTFDANSHEGLQLLGVALHNMEYLPEFKTAFTYLDKETLIKFNYKKGDTEGFVNYGLSIKNVVFAVIFIESLEEELVKISFRSKGDFDVNQFARKHFDGGGHKNAAGGRCLKTLTETLAIFKEKLYLQSDLKQ